MPAAIPIITAAAGAYSAIDGADKARKAAHAAQDQATAAANGTGGGTVNIADLQTQAQNIAKQNAANSAALDAQYNPGAAQLRTGALQTVLAGLPQTPETQRLTQLIMAQAGQPLTAPATQQYDSPLTAAAIAKAQSDLALGGALPQDVRNLVARTALGKSGTATGGLGLGRDITARDLGLTSLQLSQQRLQNASTIGAQEAALGQGNANLRQQAGALGLTAEQYGRNNLFDSASFLQNINTGNFQRALSAAQLGQNIAAPMSGLDPGSVVNLAVGNSNVAANAAEQAAARQAQTGNQQTALGGQLLGAGLGFVQNYLNKPTTPTTYAAPAPSQIPYYGYGQPGYQ